MQNARGCSLGFMKEYGISYIYQAFYKKGKSPGRMHHYFGESIMHIILPHSFSSKKNKTIIATKGFLFSGESFTSRFSLVFVQGEKTGSGRRNPKESKQEPGVQEGVTGSQTLLYLQSAMGRPPQLLWILMCGADGWYRLPLFLPRSLASLQVVNLFGEQSWEPVGTS